MRLSSPLLDYGLRTFILILYDLNLDRCPLKASWPLNFERFTTGRLSFFPENVKLCESPGRAGGSP